MHCVSLSDTFQMSHRALDSRPSTLSMPHYAPNPLTDSQMPSKPHRVVTVPAMIDVPEPASVADDFVEGTALSHF